MEMIQSQGFSMAPVDPAAVAAAESAKALIQSGYIMALKKPRNKDVARVNILNACRRTEFAKKVEWKKPVGGETISGPTIRLAELALSEWGNNRTITQVLYEDDYVMRLNVSVVDLETNVTFGKDIPIRKTVERHKKGDREVVNERKNTKNETVFIVRCTDEELMNKIGSAASRVIRTEGLRLIPSDIIDEAMNIARQVRATDDKLDPEKEKKKIIDSFFSVGVSPQDIEKYLQHPISQLVPAELENLRFIYRALKEGELKKWSDLFDEEPSQSGEGDSSDKSNKKVAEKSKEKLQNLKDKVLKKGTPPVVEPSEPEKEAIDAAVKAEVPEEISEEAPWNESEKAVEVTEETKPQTTRNRIAGLSMKGM